jgi:uncharacterized protein
MASRGRGCPREGAGWAANKGRERNPSILPSHLGCSCGGRGERKYNIYDYYIRKLHMSEPPRFVDRAHELQTLERARAGGGANLVVVLGRRRIGKTELLARFCEGKPSALIFVREAEPAAQIRAVSGELGAALGDRVASANPPGDIDGMLELAHRFLARPGRPVLVLDEFQNLAAGRREVLSAFQHAWDTRLRRLGGMLVLCGSAVGMMEEFVLSSRSPLYGRKTVQIDLKPIPFWLAGGLLPGRGLHERVLRYAVCGGVPHYLRALAGQHDLKRALERQVFDRMGPLYDEPRTSIFAETREPDRYFTLLEAIAAGASRPTEIANRSGIPVTQVTSYLKVLVESLRVVERRVPVTERRPKAKASLYRVADPFFRFWFATAAPRRSLLERGAAGRVAAEAMERLPSLAGPVFEDIVRDAMAAGVGGRLGALRLDFTSIGGWWSRAGDEVDILALGGRGGPIAVEVKLGQAPVGAREVERLAAKVPLLPLKPPIRLAVVTAGVFTAGAHEAGRERGVELLDGKSLSSFFRALEGAAGRRGRRVPQ